MYEDDHFTRIVVACAAGSIVASGKTSAASEKEKSKSNYVTSAMRPLVLIRYPYLRDEMEMSPSRHTSTIVKRFFAG